jgi:branched-chain amino acid aminotransferase/4-amino-4-deoxychorismate lyase
MINYNGKLNKNKYFNIRFNNRGLNYGDGIFETIIYYNAKIPLFHLHWTRLQEGANILQLNLPFNEEQLQEFIFELIAENGLKQKRARIKLMVWRKEGGYYTPEDNDCHYVLSVQEAGKQPLKKLATVYTANTVYLTQTPFSHIKTISALTYVMAGIEKKDRQADELILLDQDGNLAEASAANIFFHSEKENTFYTPPLSCGIINGVTRRYLLTIMEEKNIACEERKIKMNHLSDDLSIFTCNVSGIHQLACLEKQDLNNGESAYYILNNLFPFNH